MLETILTYGIVALAIYVTAPLLIVGAIWYLILKDLKKF